MWNIYFYERNQGKCNGCFQIGKSLWMSSWFEVNIIKSHQGVSKLFFWYSKYNWTNVKSYLRNLEEPTIFGEKLENLHWEALEILLKNKISTETLLNETSKSDENEDNWKTQITEGNLDKVNTETDMDSKTSNTIPLVY